jgi:hypothetical protein
MTTANVVYLSPATNVSPNRREEKVETGATILPGMLLEDNGSGEWQVHSTAGGGGDIYVADMNVIEQKSVTEALTAGQNHGAFVPQLGQVYAVILTDGETISKGDPLASAGDGKLVAATTGTATPDVTLFIAEEALSPSGADGRIAARYVNSANKASA